MTAKMSRGKFGFGLNMNNIREGLLILMRMSTLMMLVIESTLLQILTLLDGGFLHLSSNSIIFNFCKLHDR